jgi:D-lactate dehydrogenase
MKTVFFEVQDWERKLLAKSFPEATLVSEKLDESLSSQYSECEILSVFVYSRCSKETLEKMPHLTAIATRSTGYDHIDLTYCAEHHITVMNVPEYGSNTVAEHTFALILSLTRKIYQSINQAKQVNFDHTQVRGVDLKDKTIGIIGLGKIGINVLRIAQGFGMKVLAYNHSFNDELQKKYDFEYANLDNLLALSDVITLHLPLNDHTRHIINKENIVKCKQGSYLINTARGGLIDTEALILGLDSGILAGAALDVLEEENNFSDEAMILTPQFQKNADYKKLLMNHILMNHPHVLITPHNAFNSIEALERIDRTSIENIQDFLKKSPKNQVNVSHSS